MHHTQEQRLVIALTAVLQHHAMLASLLRGLHDVPAIFDSGHTVDFDCDILAVLRGVERHGRMPLPRRGNNHQVKVVAGEHLFEGMVAVCEERRLLLPLLDHQCSSRFGFGADDIAQRDHFPVCPRMLRRRDVPRPPVPMMPMCGSRFSKATSIMERCGLLLCSSACTAALAAIAAPALTCMNLRLLHSSVSVSFIAPPGS